MSPGLKDGSDGSGSGKIVSHQDVREEDVRRGVRVGVRNVDPVVDRGKVSLGSSLQWRSPSGRDRWDILGRVDGRQEGRVGQIKRSIVNRNQPTK